MPLSCKILVKIGQVDSAENILIEIASLHRGSAYFFRISLDVLDQFSQSFHYMKAIYVMMMDLYLFFQFVKGRCHGNQILLP